jgi:hypothetical protein
MHTLTLPSANVVTITGYRTPKVEQGHTRLPPWEPPIRFSPERQT